LDSGGPGRGGYKNHFSGFKRRFMMGKSFRKLNHWQKASSKKLIPKDTMDVNILFRYLSVSSSAVQIDILLSFL
jgi:hypothetical protein